MEVQTEQHVRQGRSGNRSKKLKLVCAVFAGFSLHFSTGAIISWPSPVMGNLNLTDTESSLISSLFSLGAAPGPLIVTLGLDTIGRKGTLYVVSLFFLVSWIMVSVSQDVILIYVARLIGGIGVGGAFSGVSVYVAEICDEKLRGPLGSLLQSFMAVGFLVEYCVGPYVKVWALGVVSLAVTVLFAVAFFFFSPESPYYLLAKGKVKEAYSALVWLRGNVPEEEIHKEIAEIQSTLKKENETVSGIKKVCTSCSVYKGLAICFFLLMMQQGSGMNAVLAYVQDIFENASVHLPAEVVPMLVGFTNLFASLPAPFLVRLLGNKVVFIVSTLGAGICLCLLGVYFKLIDHGYDVSSLDFLPVISIILYNVFFCVGLGPLVWAVAAELFSPSIKGLCMGMCGAFSALFGFLVIEVFSIILHTYGYPTVFFSFGIYLIIGAIMTFLFIPDTSRMSLSEIQNYLEGIPSAKTGSRG